MSETRYETTTVDRRTDYFARSAPYRNAENDFAARYARGEAYQAMMGWRRTYVPPAKKPSMQTPQANVVSFARKTVR